jgi:hypothetical protein
LKVEDEGEEKPKGEFSLRLEEIIYLFIFSNPRIQILLHYTSIRLGKKKKEKKNRLEG